MPTQLPERVFEKPETSNGPAWIAGILAIGVLIGLTLRPPALCDLGSDVGCVSPEAPTHFVRIVMARTAPLTAGTR